VEARDAEISASTFATSDVDTPADTVTAAALVPLALDEEPFKESREAEATSAFVPSMVDFCS
jgi:hypothetical protein